MMNGKKMRFVSYLLMVALFSIFMTACAEKEVQVAEEPAAVEEPVQEAVVEPAPEIETVAPMEEVKEVSYEVLEGRTNGPMLPVYFDFDRSNIRPDQVQRLEANAMFLKENAGLTIRIEGNCDERGTNEYNMALGERRAISAKKYLMNLGVSASQLDTISFGEEKALNPGHNALAWSQNRRDDFVIMNR